MDEDGEILAEFLVESHENLDRLDHDLVALEQQPGSRELLDSAFRALHTIKGTSGFLALNRLERLAHAGESLLSRVRDGRLGLSEEVTELLLGVGDTIRRLLGLIEASGSDRQSGQGAVEVDVDPIIEAVRAVLEAGGAEAGTRAFDGARAMALPPPPTVPAPGPLPAQAPSPDSGGAGDPGHSVVGNPGHSVAANPGHSVATNPGHSVADSTVRVDVDLLDALVQQVGELVLVRNQILQRAEGLDDPGMARAAQRLDLVAGELQESVMHTRMQPIEQVWSKMPRIVRDLARQLGREVDLDLSGHETELDRSLLEALRGPLTHLVRNGLDHGIEPPQARVAAGKPPAGRLGLTAFHDSGQVVVEVSDDGAGIDPARIAESAIARGVVTGEAVSRMSRRDVVNLIFTSGLSTSATVTNVSGRGVGMDVVRTNIERIGGTVEVDSEPGRGTTCRVRIPLTLAIMPALMIGEGGERYAVPQSNLLELVRLEAEQIARDVEVLAGAAVLRLRGRLLPLLSLREALGGQPGLTPPLTVVIVQSADRTFGLCVEEVHDVQEIVVKPLGRPLRDLPEYLGATVLGDGRAALILDVSGLASRHDIAADGPDTEVEEAAPPEETVPLLVLEVAGGQRAALPLGEVSRLEEFDPGDVDVSGPVEAVRYRDGLLRLVRLQQVIGTAPATSTAGTTPLCVVVHEVEDRRIGIVVDRIVDILEEPLAPSALGRRPGVSGSAVVGGRLTALIDLPQVLEVAT